MKTRLLALSKLYLPFILIILSFCSGCIPDAPENHEIAAYRLEQETGLSTLIDQLGFCELVLNKHLSFMKKKKVNGDIQEEYIEGLIQIKRMKRNIMETSSFVKKTSNLNRLVIYPAETIDGAKQQVTCGELLEGY
ncbi:hypothetical protein [Bacterioplanoides pacificum]|uniref:Uncharacterized protein n=1 Tax=Bacterioplanoides pacificum TaxID=1171596 RepID=A0ABV7VTK8_9GAMM